MPSIAQDRQMERLPTECGASPNFHYKTQVETRQDIFHYIEVLYNRNRLHSVLGYMSPARFEDSLRMCAN